MAVFTSCLFCSWAHGAASAAAKEGECGDGICLPSLLSLTVQHSSEGQKGQGEGGERHTKLEALVGQELEQGRKQEMSLGGGAIKMTECRKNEEARQSLN